MDVLRAQLYVVFATLVAANAAIFGVLHAVHLLPGSSSAVVIVLAVSCGVSLKFPFMLKLGGSLRVLAPLLMVLFQTALVAVALSDGGLRSASVVWLVVTPLAAAFIGGARLGVVIAITSATAATAMFAASTAGYVFPVSLSVEDTPLHYVLNVISAVGLVAVLAVLYEGPMVRNLSELSSSLAKANASLRTELVERRHAQHRAESASRAKDALLANMSHEFRTPLTAILGCTEVLLDEAAQDHRPFLQSIDRGGRRLLVTLDGVLDLAWIESGGADLNPAPVDLRSAVDEAAALYRPVALRKGLTYKVNGTGTLAAVDAAALHRVIVALLDNAVRFTDKGSVTVAIDANDDGATMEVVDTGVGMDPEFLPVALEPFRQASEGEARTHEGAGLGLTVAHRLVDLMGGTLGVASTPGGGTTVRVCLPREASALPATSAPADLSLLIRARGARSVQRSAVDL